MATATTTNDSSFSLAQQTFQSVSNYSFELSYFFKGMAVMSLLSDSIPRFKRLAPSQPSIVHNRVWEAFCGFLEVSASSYLGYSACSDYSEILHSRLGHDKSPPNQVERDFMKIFLQSDGTPKEVMAAFKQNMTKYTQHSQYVGSLIEKAKKKELPADDFTYFEGAEPVLLLTGDHSADAEDENAIAINFKNYAPSITLKSERVDNALGICQSLHRAAKQLPPNVKIPVVTLSAHGNHNTVQIGNKLITTRSKPKLPSDCFDPMSRDGLFILMSCRSGSKPFKTSIAAHLSKLFNRTVLAPEEGVQGISPHPSYMNKTNPYPLHYFKHFNTPLVSAQFMAVEDYKLDEKGEEFTVKKDSTERLHFFINGKAYPQKSIKEDL